MKILLYSVLVLFVIISTYFIGLSLSSRKQPNLGILNGQLHACPETPNCVSSERQGTKGFVEPLTPTATVNNAGVNAWRDSWLYARQAVLENGGEIVTERHCYLHARFVTPFMRYIDDVELRLDEGKQLIHIRSASRVGRSDFGVNRTRVSKIRKAFFKNAQNN
jgi:uncharacterized protein (DUF1499 family)